MKLMETVSGKNLTFAAYWEKLVARYVKEQNTCGKCRWREMQLIHSERISCAEWRDFKVKLWKHGTMCLGKMIKSIPNRDQQITPLSIHSWWKNKKKGNTETPK